ncbi:MAG: hypothetical protein AAF682_11290 [Planctomycetota bacterium]
MQHSSASPRRPVRPAGLILFLVLAATLDALACRAGGPARVTPAAAPASIAFAQGQAALVTGDEAAALASFERAHALDPAWVAPRRVLDDLARAALRGPDVLAQRRRELREHPSSAALHYLTGRLEGRAGIARFERGIDLDRELAWNHHGLAWNSYLGGGTRSAMRHGRLARERAKDTWEHTYFTIASARYELSLGRAEQAAKLLEHRLSEPDLLASDRTSLHAWLAQAELTSARAALAERGYRRGLDLLATADLAQDDLARLVRALLEAPVGLREAGGALEVAAALAVREGEGRRPLRAGILLEAGAPAIALALLRDDPAGVRARGRLRAVRFARGDGAGAVEDWLADLPAFLRDAEGLPPDPRLRGVVSAARGGDENELAGALLAAGWFAEARGLAEDLALRDLDAALGLEARASAGVVLLAGVDRILRLVDRGQAYGGPWTSAIAPSDAETKQRESESLRPIESLDGLLAALSPLFQSYRLALGEDGGPLDLAASPRTRYGPVAAVVHPGPTFTRADEDAGRGAEGEAVGGLAAELLAIGRFGIFGEALGGGGPDGTLLRRLWVEERSGTHLGVPWAGTVAWCEGADVESRPGRRGARISGAALHEGYWVDVEAVREELLHWRRLEERFLPADVGPEEAERLGLEVDAALAVRGVRTELGTPPAALVPLLGQGDRVRLAVLRDRAARRVDGEPLVSLDELVLLTALHEEGHLCDRTRFLPLGSNLLGALRLFADAGFTPGGLMRELEERAQLICMAEADDARLPLSDVLAAAEHGGSVTPHAAAYRGLLISWLRVLADLCEDPGRFPALDRGHVLVHQLHLLSAEEVTEVSRALARRKGLVAD